MADEGVVLPQPADRFSLPVRWLLFFLGVWVMSLGIAVTIRAQLGTTPISTPPAALAAWTSTVGVWTITMNALFVVIQVLLLRREFPLKGYLQFLVAVAFGSLIDVSLHMTWFLNPGNYLEKWALVLLGTVLVALGVFIEVLPGIMYVPGEGIVSAIARVTGWNFGTVKQCFDWSLVVIAIVISLVLNGHVVGVREGTVCAAFGVGALVRVFQRIDQERLRKKHFGY